MNTANFEKGDTVLLVMNLSNPNFMTDLYASTANLQLSKKPECPFDIKTFVGSYVADETGYGKYNVNFTADAANPNRIWQSNFWDWTSDLLAFDLDPVNGTVNVPEQTIVMGNGSGYLVVGSGTFDPCTGIMIVDFQGDVVTRLLGRSLHSGLWTKSCQKAGNKQVLFKTMNRGSSIRGPFFFAKKAPGFKNSMVKSCLIKKNRLFCVCEEFY